MFPEDEVLKCVVMKELELTVKDSARNEAATNRVKNSQLTRPYEGEMLSLRGGWIFLKSRQLLQNSH